MLQDNVGKKIIDFSDLKKNGVAQELKSEVQNEMDLIDRHFITQTQFNAIKRGNGYQIAQDMRKDIEELVISKTYDRQNLKKWFEIFVPQIKTGTDLK